MNTRIAENDVPAILGVDPQRTAFDVWLEKTGRVSPPAVLPIAEQILDLIPAEYCRIRSAQTRRYGYPIEQGIFRARIHRLVCGKDAPAFKNEIRTDTSLHLEVVSGLTQIHIQQFAHKAMHIMNLVTCLSQVDIAVLDFTTMQVKVFRVERDESKMKGMRGVLEEWWQKHVAGNEMPALKTTRDKEKHRSVFGDAP